MGREENMCSGTVSHPQEHMCVSNSARMQKDERKSSRANKGQEEKGKKFGGGLVDSSLNDRPQNLR